MKLGDFIDKKSYKKFAGSSWPIYDDFINGVRSPDSVINRELDEFVATMKSRVDNLRMGDGTKLAEENQIRQGQVFYNKNFVAAATCRVPWNTMGINANGQVFICNSPSWIPKFLGSILDVDDIYELLNSPLAQSIRNEILQHRYYYCNSKLCNFFGMLNAGLYQHKPNTDQDVLLTESVAPTEDLLVSQIPINIIFDFDLTCNFKCPSCRTEVINTNKDHLIRPINNKIVDKIKTLVLDKIEDQLVTIRWAGGEPFISEPYLDLFEYIINCGKPNIQNIVQTNGSQLTSPTVERLLPYISELRISFDAGTAETYKKIRVNGSWEKLISNTQHVLTLIKQQQTNTLVTVDFVVQLENYKEIPDLVKLCTSMGVSKINLQKMWNWGTWDIETFKKKNVYDPAHPLYDDLKKYFALAGMTIQN